MVCDSPVYEMLPPAFVGGGTVEQLSPLLTATDDSIIHPTVYRMNPCCLSHVIPSSLIRSAEAHRSHIRDCASSTYWNGPSRAPTLSQSSFFACQPSFARRRWPVGTYYVATRLEGDSEGVATLERGHSYLHSGTGACPPHTGMFDDDFDDEEEFNDEGCDTGSDYMSSSICSSFSSSASVMPESFHINSSQQRFVNQEIDCISSDKTSETDFIHLDKIGLFHLRHIPYMSVIDPSTLPDTADQFIVWMPSETLSLHVHRKMPATISQDLNRFHWLPCQGSSQCSCHLSRVMADTISRDIMAEVIRRKLRRSLLLPAHFKTHPSQAQCIFEKPASTVPKPVASMWRNMAQEAYEVITLAEIRGDDPSASPYDPLEAQRSCLETSTARGRADSGVGDISDDDEDEDNSLTNTPRSGVVRQRRSTISITESRAQPYQLRGKPRKVFKSRSFLMPVFQSIIDIQNYTQDIISHLG
ncbi:hypothetical protein BC829DRAFT_386311 [Chytridium lagenaria]|nr:hypothetical protein BC829DRAFT_386311 [Chytridium lagenaria]